MKTLFVAWRGTGPKNGYWAPVGRLDFEGGNYRFCYTHGARAKASAGFQPFPQMNDLDQVYESEELFPVFANRLLSRSRPEYDTFLRWGGIEPDSEPDPIAILGVTEGIRQTDSFEVFPCPSRHDGSFVTKFFLHSVQRLPPPAADRIGQLHPADPLFPMRDEFNATDPLAAAVRTDDPKMLIGYVPRYFSPDLWKLSEMTAGNGLGRLAMSVDRVNPDAPPQHRLLCRVEANWPEGFHPCSGEEYQPIPQNLPAHCS
jgi:hypothetical protein